MEKQQEMQQTKECQRVHKSETSNMKRASNVENRKRQRPLGEEDGLNSKRLRKDTTPLNTISYNGLSQTTTLSEKEALDYGINSKNYRTKIYSGAKTNNLPKLALPNLHLKDGNISLPTTPLDTLMPVIEKATAQQLMNLEKANPYLLGNTDSLWEQHCKRMFRNQKRIGDFETWRDMFLRCSEERDAKLNSLIKQSLAKETAPMRRTKITFVDRAENNIKQSLAKETAPMRRTKVASVDRAEKPSRSENRPPVAANVTKVPAIRKKAPMMAKLLNSIKGTGFRR